MMDWNLAVIIASLIFWLAVTVGANIWVIKGDSTPDVDPSFDKFFSEIYEHLDLQASNTEHNQRIADANGDREAI
jgi:hypothetical protein